MQEKTTYRQQLETQGFVQVSTFIPKRLRREMRKSCLDQNVTMSQYLTRLIEQDTEQNANWCEYCGRGIEE